MSTSLAPVIRKKSISAKIGALLTLWFFNFVRRSVRLHVTNDRREQIKRDSTRQFIYAILHAHQVAAVALSDPNTGALVSRSRDGDIVVPLLKACGCVPIRGSSGQGRKGGATALTQMIRHVQSGHPAVLAVDGPKGPRGKVQKGIAMLAQKTGVPILPVVMVPQRRYILAKAWDRLQLPMPTSVLKCRFGDPIYAHEHDDLDEISRRVEASLAWLEHCVDPEEAQLNRDRSGDPIPLEVVLESAHLPLPENMPTTSLRRAA
ncbi:lysophospholipid acyltransferase family protein [Neorhodopirellula pilleata]|uniref:DUF374 domain-containing protein n=1 Tax=Neorhodopirellula pilleata TaxID=2714738 RepID=A0A5C6AVV6_9BACT|nr:lysophospholipid acyltransferase family protein [Neorhodopirellula pilleata]TWU03890.1 hypothetical protein Pla100_08250 [Neorhodopirellula pilleata]